MYGRYNDCPPDWYLAALADKMYSRPRRRTTKDDFLSTIMRWERYQELKEEKKKKAEKEKKEKEKGNPFKSAFSFVQWLGIMTVVGLPVGLVVLSVLNTMVTHVVPMLIKSAIK